MIDNKLNRQIANLMEDVQQATLCSDINHTQDGYISDVNRRIGEIETAISILKYELTKHGLNNW